MVTKYHFSQWVRLSLETKYHFCFQLILPVLLLHVYSLLMSVILRVDRTNLFCHVQTSLNSWARHHTHWFCDCFAFRFGFADVFLMINSFANCKNIFKVSWVTEYPKWWALKSKKKIIVQVNIFQKLSFLNQLTHNMTRDCSIEFPQKYKFTTCCVQILFWMSKQKKTVFVHIMFWTCVIRGIKWTISCHIVG